MRPPAPPASSSCPSRCRSRRRTGGGSHLPSASGPQIWLATREISAAASSAPKYRKRRATKTAARTSRRNPGARNALIPAGSAPCRSKLRRVCAFIRISRLVVPVSLVLCVVTAQSARAATPGAQAFEQGIQAFRAGNYQGALQSFLDALKAGLDTPGLRYDLGATYYRLQRYPEAEREFQALAPDPRWAPLAHYNLGLTAQRLGRPQQAMEYFGEARRTTTDPNLRALAATALERLGPATPRTSALVSLAGGYDSNVTLSQDAATVGASHRSDSFVETFAAASHRLTENPERGWVAHGGLVVRKYRDL